MESYQKYEKHIETETKAMCQIGFTKKEIAETLQLPLTVISDLIWRLNHENTNI